MARNNHYSSDRTYTQGPDERHAVDSRGWESKTPLTIEDAKKLARIDLDDGARLYFEIKDEEERRLE